MATLYLFATSKSALIVESNLINYVPTIVPVFHSSQKFFQLWHLWSCSATSILCKIKSLSEFIITMEYTTNFWCIEVMMFVCSLQSWQTRQLSFLASQGFYFQCRISSFQAKDLNLVYFWISDDDRKWLESQRFGTDMFLKCNSYRWRFCFPMFTSGEISSSHPVLQQSWNSMKILVILQW